MAPSRVIRTMLTAVATIATMTLGGCGLTMPSDPDGTLDRVTDGVLRVGTTQNGDRVVVGDDGPSGEDIDLVKGFADTLGSDLEWVVGAEESLVRELGTGRLDLIVGGITDETPWSDNAGVTRPYTEITDIDGTTHKLVMLTPLGENAFISALEEFLTEHGGGEER